MFRRCKTCEFLNSPGMDLEMSLTALSTVGRGVLERQLKFQSSSISPLLLLLFFHALTKEASNGVGSNCTDFIIHSNTIKNAGSSGSPLTFLHPKPVIRSTPTTYWTYLSIVACPKSGSTCWCGQIQQLRITMGFKLAAAAVESVVLF